MVLETPIEKLSGTRPETIKRLKSVGIKTYFDLVNYFPFRYEDYSTRKDIKDLVEGETVTIAGTVTASKTQYTRRRLTIQKITVDDQSGAVDAVWFNQPYLIRLFPKDSKISLAGSLKKGVFEVREYEKLDDKKTTTVHTGKIIPVYPAKRGLSSRIIREKVAAAAKLIADSEITIPDFLPRALLKKYGLEEEDGAYKRIHFPTSLDDVVRARSRLSFDEFFTIQLSAKLVRKNWEKTKVKHNLNVNKHQKEIDVFIKSLPFQLTQAQKRIWQDLAGDLGKTHPMNRFLQGDVGSGKTVIAALCAYVAYLEGYDTVFMAPTEILATQHYETLLKFFKNTKVTVGLYTGSSKTHEKVDILVGTHALISKKKIGQEVALVIIDEQHRFGVAQRGLLKEKSGNPHLLTMTATPIPRTVALTLYGELDLSVLDEMPPGRTPIKSHLVPKHKRDDGYRWIAKKVSTEGDQVFIICPLIEESEVETMKSVKAAIKEYEHLKTTVFSHLRVGLIHGKLPAKEKTKIMRDFHEKKYDILVSTSVIEVGIDIPNATVIIIEGAERYGLAQLHQLRGRVGRGKKESYCFVMTESENPKVLERLTFFSGNTSGARLAEYDLRMRGAGDLYGTKQHGEDTLTIASLSDFALIEQAGSAAQEFMRQYDLKDYPAIAARIEKLRVNQIAKD